MDVYLDLWNSSLACLLTGRVRGIVTGCATGMTIESKFSESYER